MRTVLVVSAGLSQPSSTRLLADQLAEATVRHLPQELAVTTVELRDLAHDITNAMLTGFAPPALQAVLDELATADAMIAVTPTFNASFSGLFKSFFDVVGTEALVDVPVLVGATGGTERHSLVLDHALRPMFTYLHALVVPLGVYAASSDWGTADATEALGASALGARVDRAGAQLAAAIGSSSRRVAVDEFADVVPFEQLLRR